jgi:hypothetical protein
MLEIVSDRFARQFILAEFSSITEDAPPQWPRYSEARLFLAAIKSLP